MHNGYKIFIKNMVCPRCINAVERVLEDLGVNFDNVKLGSVDVNQKPSEKQKSELGIKLNELGFELLESNKSQLISKLKTLIIEQVHYSNESLKVNYSTYLAENLRHDYSYLSRLFSSIEDVTIEKFITLQKIERVKELLFYGNLNLSEIAFKMNYSSVSHLSGQFKKETGMTPSRYKKQSSLERKSLDE